MKSIDNTSNIKNKQALRDLQKEINELEQHSGEISQYDLDNARRRYELELARLQLEEARDAKSTVRLSKDSEGNWSYVYTANQDEVEKAEQNYEDKLYAMQQANGEYINSLSDQILALEEQYAEKLAEIRLDNTMSEEERNAAIERLNAYFAEQMEYLTNEGQKAVDNNARLFEEEWTTYHNWTDAFGNDVQARINNQHDFMTQFGDTILGTYTGYGNFDELNAAMVQIAEEASVKWKKHMAHFKHKLLLLWKLLVLMLLILVKWYMVLLMNKLYHLHKLLKMQLQKWAKPQLMNLTTQPMVFQHGKLNIPQKCKNYSEK